MVVQEGLHTLAPNRGSSEMLPNLNTNLVLVFPEFRPYACLSTDQPPVMTVSGYSCEGLEKTTRSEGMNRSQSKFLEGTRSIS
jgi:hypothetical protein